MILNYRKPPITEALLDIRVEPRSGVSAVEIATGFADWAEEFPTRHEIAAPSLGAVPGGLQPVFSIGFLPGQPILGGFRYVSANGQRIFQARLDGFIFSFIGSIDSRYPGWDRFRALVTPLWERYRDIWQPQAVVRVALRYVNRFDTATAGAADTAEYLRTMNIPRAHLLTAPIEVAGYNMRVVLPQSDIGATAIINNSMEAILDTQSGLSTILDIDLFQESLRLDPKDDVIWEKFDQLRSRKNQLFRTYISDAVEQTLDPIG